MDDYICMECKRAQEGSSEELYCICRTPYDESQYVMGCFLSLTHRDEVNCKINHLHRSPKVLRQKQKF